MSPEFRLAVIIPFYQKESGILKRALDSIIAQNFPVGLAVHVFVIDDDSPIPSASEMVDLPTRDNLTFSSHRRENGGPGLARNTGLDYVAQDGGYDFVAFLDSDDEWMPSHIHEAIEALDRGYDFYFCDNQRGGFFDHYSDSNAELSNRGATIRGLAEWQSENGLLLGFGALTLVERMIKSYLCQTSTVVVRAATVATVRFDHDLRSAGEDHFYWILVILGGARTIISWKTNVLCGRGVNIFFGAFDWNELATLNRVGNLTILGEKITRLDQLDSCSRRSAIRTRRRYRRAYAYLIVRAMIKRQAWYSSTFKNLQKIDPLFPLRIPFLATRLAVDRSPDSRVF